MPQSHGTRRRPSGTKRSGRVPPPRRAPEAGPYGPGAFGPDDPRDPYGPAEPGVPPERRHRIRRVLTSNITIMVAAIAVLGAALTVVDLGSFVDDGSKPPKAAAAGLSTNDMLAKLTSASDMDPIVADSIAAAKKRAYEEHQRELKRLKAKAKRDAKARAKLKAEKEKERLAKLNPSSKQNKAYGKKMSALKGWGGCWSSLLTLWNHESGWNERAENPGSGAYGIPQALPGSKMSSIKSDWRTSTPTQIAWGLGYIKARYKDPCGAWSWWQAHNWY
ncbi:lytic transglycosylase domain-containing protein [Actinomadura darangshiensis]|uniref:Lytic transglycosylase domain-containing protein n=1 Tax=Actinomadura darangshiensis TaxID=705336 RepID=A0A4R5B160_9ACTN|nr:lytic transglycosylase domain-containing protein [Actinomadura darangshiensis]TDD76712.1 lytic transglycosylase domain-containing protein [Actinomadura darangshiensis]